MPIGGAKGSALALAVEILTGVLTGSAFGPHVKNIYNDREAETANVGHFFILFDIEKFMELELFFASIQNLLGEMKSVAKAEGAEEIRYPGERRKRELEKRRIEGIPLAPALEMELAELGFRYHVQFPEPVSLQVN